MSGFWRRLGRAIFGARGKRAAAYSGAKTTRLRADWTRSNTGPNAISRAEGGTLRARSRDLVRNDAHCARAIEVIAGSVVGTGIEPRAGVKRDSRRSTALQRKADDIWEAWAQPGVADIEGQHTLSALTMIAARAWIESGEAFIRRIFEPAGSVTPIRIQVLEADMLDDMLSGTTDTSNGNRIEQGIELDSNGRRVAYHFRTAHPGDSSVFGGIALQTVRVPAQDVIHLYLALRPGQLRGLPFLAPIMAMKRDLGDFEAFELIRKKTEALVVAMVSPGDRDTLENPGADLDDEEGDNSLVPVAVDSDGNLVGDLRPGAILGLENGKTVQFNSPQISGNYDVYKKAMLQSIAVGMQMTYETLTGDLSNVNYTSYRAGHIQFNAYIDRLQWNHFIPTVMDRLWHWRMSAAFLQGQLPTSDVPREWATPKRTSVDPGADAVADIIEIRAGLALLTDKQAERGYQPTRWLEAKRLENQALDDNQIVLDADPRKMAFRGAFPPAVAGTNVATTPDAEATSGVARSRPGDAMVRRLGLVSDGTPLPGDGRDTREGGA